jgi:predicted nucleic acid-binding protein
VEVVLDSNVLFRTLISGGGIVELFFNNNLELFAPEKLKQELFKNKNEISAKSKFSEEEFNRLVSIISNIVTFVPLDEYREFLPKAKLLLGEHAKDEEFIALCLMKDVKLWTYETLLFEIGFGISTKQIAEKLSGL